MSNLSQITFLLLQLVMRNIVLICIATGVLAFITCLVGDCLKKKNVNRVARGIAASQELEIAARCCQIVGIVVMILCFLVLCLSGAYEPFINLFRR